MKVLERLIPKPSPEITRQARQRAQQEAAERGISIERICVVATSRGIVRVDVLDEE